MTTYTVEALIEALQKLAPDAIVCRGREPNPNDDMYEEVYSISYREDAEYVDAFGDKVRGKIVALF